MNSVIRLTTVAAIGLVNLSSVGFGAISQSEVRGRPPGNKSVGSVGPTVGVYRRYGQTCYRMSNGIATEASADSCQPKPVQVAEGVRLVEVEVDALGNPIRPGAAVGTSSGDISSRDTISGNSDDTIAGNDPFQGAEQTISPKKYLHIGARGLREIEISSSGRTQEYSKYSRSAPNDGCVVQFGKGPGGHEYYDRVPTGWKPEFDVYLMPRPKQTAFLWDTDHLWEMQYREADGATKSLGIVRCDADNKVTYRKVWSILNNSIFRTNKN